MGTITSKNPHVNIGLIGGNTAIVVASDAPAAIIAAANALKSTMGDLIQVCDGTADDVEIQLALNALSSGRTHIEKVLLMGKFYFSSYVELASYTEIELIGEIYLNNASNTPVIYATSKTNLYIHGSGKIDGNYTNQTQEYPAVITPLVSLDNCDYCDVSELTLVNSNDSGVRLNDCTYSKVHDLYVANARSDCIGLDGTGSYIDIYNNTVINPGADDVIGGPSGIEVPDYSYVNVVDNIGYSANKIVDGANIAFITIHPGGGDNIIIKGNNGNGFYYGVRVSDDATNLLIEGNNLHDLRWGILFSSESEVVSDSQILNNTIDTCTAGGIVVNILDIDIIVEGNTCIDCTDEGIYLKGVRQHAIGNYCYDTRSGGSRTQLYGIKLETTSDSCVVSNNILYNNITSNLLNSGTNNTIKNNNGYLSSGDIITISEVIDHASITDNADATGYYDFTNGTIPANCKVLSVVRDITEAFKDTVGNNTAVNVMLGDGTDDDRWDKTAANGDDIWNSTTDAAWDYASFQGTVVTSAAKTPRMTFTTDSDMTDLISGAGAQGKMTVSITYRKL